MGSLVLALSLAIPATIPASHYGGLPTEYGLAFIWAAFALVAALGLAESTQRKRKLVRRGSVSVQAPTLARA